VLNKVAYAATNPVAAGLVKQPSEWPGLNYWSTQSKEVYRPTVYFDAMGQLPEKVCLNIVPPLREKKSSWTARVRAAVSRRVRKLRRHQGDVVGIRKVMAQSFLARPKARELRWTVKPVLSSVDVARRAA